MKQRFRERRFKTGPRKGQIFRTEIMLPFSLQEFLSWAEKQIGGMNGSVKCAYCARYLDARDVGFDHRQPVEQGGSVTLDNLVCTCNECNRYKGPLTPTAFDWIRRVLKEEIGKNLTIADAKDLERRLRSGGGFFKTSKRAKDATAALKAKQKEDDDF
jgi:5-methylcytosine-specific restriction endonuclease McrA